MENQINVGGQNTQQTDQNPVSQPVQVLEKPKFNFWMISTIILATLLLGILGWVFLISQQSSTIKTNAPISSTGVVKNQTANNDFNVTKVIVNPTKFEPPNKNQDALKYGYGNESVLGKYEADIGILLTSPYQCPKEAISVKEYEGSILGSFGNKAVTYFLPQLNTTSCTKSGSENQYKLYVKWSRRSDTDWTILIPGYSGTENANKEFMMFTQKITKNSQFDQAKADELKEYAQNLITTSIYSLTNNPKIISAPDVSFDSGGKRLKLVMNFEFGNPCFANVDMELEIQIWQSGNTAYLWANPRAKAKSGSGGCPEIYFPTKKQVELYIPLSLEVSSATILIPNYPAGKDLPVYIKNIGL